MATTEIEKLERRYAENPHGLTFAPLAEVHRKNGDVGRALELLKAGLELHPNYIPASIVLGRCHWDGGDLPAAESAFAHVLRLDDENVIALKSLADINERLERFGEAQRWLNRLLSIDRSNDEARQQLTRLETAKQQSDRKPSSPAPAAAVPDPTPPSSVAATAAPQAASASPLPSEMVVAEAGAPKPKPEPVAPAPPEPAPLDLTAAIADPPSGKASPPAEPVAPPEPEEPKSLALEFLDTSEPARSESGSSATVDEPAPLSGLISAEFVPPKESNYRLHPELTQDFVPGPEPLDRLDPGPEPLDRLEVETAEEVELQSSGASEFRVPNAAEDFMDLAAGISTPAEPAAPQSPPPPAPAPAPAAKGPPRLEPEPAAVPPQKPSYAARDTKGQSVAAFFAALLTSRPAGATSPPANPDNSPTTPSSAKEPLPVPASEPAAIPGVSFDEFFGAATGGSSAATTGTNDPGKDDLDQFQSWLQNLKR
jgi:tetratricopeptide repeat protein